MADTAADVRLNHQIHLLVGDQWDWPVDVFEERVLSELRCTHKIRRVQLVFVQRVIPERLEHVGQQANVAQQVERHVLFESLPVKVFPHVLRGRIVSLRALHAAEFVEKASSGGQAGSSSRAREST